MGCMFPLMTKWLTAIVERKNLVAISKIEEYFFDETNIERASSFRMHC